MGVSLGFVTGGNVGIVVVFVHSLVSCVCDDCFHCNGLMVVDPRTAMKKHYGSNKQ